MRPQIHPKQAYILAKVVTAHTVDCVWAKLRELLRLLQIGTKQTSSDPLGALVPVVLAGATAMVAKLFHKQHKQQKKLQHKQGLLWPSLQRATPHHEGITIL